MGTPLEDLDRDRPAGPGQQLPAERDLAAPQADLAHGPLLSAVVWVVSLMIAVVVIKGTRIGPVILVVSQEHGWGVHVGDLVALLPLIRAAFWQRQRNRQTGARASAAGGRAL